MARLEASDLLLSYTPAATGTHPTSGDIGSLITDLYKQSYTYIYSHEDYSADESTDVNSIIDTDGFRAALKIEAQRLIERWHEAGLNSDGTIVKMPDLELSDKFKKKIDMMIVKDDENVPIDSVRLYGSTYTDYEGLFY